jgi:hypothetical protein
LARLDFSAQYFRLFRPASGHNRFGGQNNLAGPAFVASVFAQISAINQQLGARQGWPFFEN